ncbi:MAG: hypothetical protein Alpg2KO_25280 [Alphaproteobacteria bacterium]
MKRRRLTMDTQRDRAASLQFWMPLTAAHVRDRLRKSLLHGSLVLSLSVLLGCCILLDLVPQSMTVVVLVVVSAGAVQLVRFTNLGSSMVQNPWTGLMFRLLIALVLANLALKMMYPVPADGGLPPFLDHRSHPLMWSHIAYDMPQDLYGAQIRLSETTLWFNQLVLPVMQVAGVFCCIWTAMRLGAGTIFTSRTSRGAAFLLLMFSFVISNVGAIASYATGAGWVGRDWHETRLLGRDRDLTIAILPDFSAEDFLVRDHLAGQ